MPEPNWSIGQTEGDHGVSLCGFRADLPKQLIIDWPFTDVQDNGLPVAEEYDLVTQFQDDFRKPLEAKGDAILAVISTGNGYREWYFYCRDPQVIVSRLNCVINGRDLPVQLHAGADPDWDAYNSFVSPFM